MCICVFTLDVTLDDVCVCGAQTGLWMWCEVMCVCTCACQRGKCAGVESVLVGAWFMSVNIHSGCLKNFSLCASVSCYSICSAPFLCLLDKFEEMNCVTVFPAATQDQNGTEMFVCVSVGVSVPTGDWQPYWSCTSVGQRLLECLKSNLTMILTVSTLNRQIYSVLLVSQMKVIC